MPEDKSPVNSRVYEPPLDSIPVPAKIISLIPKAAVNPLIVIFRSELVLANSTTTFSGVL